MAASHVSPFFWIRLCDVPPLRRGVVRKVLKVLEILVCVLLNGKMSIRIDTLLATMGGLVDEGPWSLALFSLAFSPRT